MFITFINFLSQMSMYEYVTFAFAGFHLVCSVLSQNCHSYWNNKSPCHHFGTASVYDQVRGDIRDIPQLDGCTPVSVWAIVRHGTRNPLKKYLDGMKEITVLKDDILQSHAEKKGSLCAQDIDNLKEWTWDESINNDTTAQLTKEGHQELYQLGSRIREKYHDLLESLDEYIIKPTKEQRTIESAKAFVKGLQYEKLPFNIHHPLERDEIIRPYAKCDVHSKEVWQHPRVEKEINRYHDNQEFKQIQTAVSHRLGLNFTLTAQNLTSLFDLCRFLRLYTPDKRHPWCSVFSNCEICRLEYVYEDLPNYYRCSYGGGEMNLKLGSAPLKNLYQTLESAVNSAKKTFTAYFSHDTMLIMMFSALGLYKDYPELSGFERIVDRKFKTTHMSPFAANLITVLNKCSVNGTQEHKVQFLINEVETHICKDRACSWQEFQQKFQPYLDVNLDFCKNNIGSGQ